MRPHDVGEVLRKSRSQRLLKRDLVRLAYVARDGTPRVIPIGMFWNGAEIVMCTPKNARKLPDLRRNPAVALTIDTEVHPPHVLLLRGHAVLDPVDCVPPEYLHASGCQFMTAAEREEFEAECTATYADGMVRIVVRPTWARLIDFEGSLPVSLQELIDRREEREAVS